MLDDTSWGVVAGSTSNPNLNGNVVSAKTSELKKAIISKTTAICRPLNLLLICIVIPNFFELIFILLYNHPQSAEV